MHALLLIYIPVVVFIVWATVKVYKRMNALEAALVGFIGFVIVANGIIRHFELCNYSAGGIVVFVQQMLLSMIVPCAYMYFARQVGRPILNETSALLLSLLAFLAFPNMVVFTDSTKTVSDVGFMSFLIVGKELHVYTIADFVIVMQSAITVMRGVPLCRTIKKYGLTISMDVKRFLTWWSIATVFVIFASYNSDREDYDFAIDVVCRISFMLIVTRAFYKIGKGFDFRPILKEEDKHVELEEFVSQSRELAMRLKDVLDSYETIPNGYSADDAIAAIGTNRTYFFRMVKAEFGCTFTELVNRKRIEKVKKMLLESKDTMAVIAENCGFGNSSYMSKIFKQLCDVTPSEWKNRMMQKS